MIKRCKNPIKKIIAKKRCKRDFKKASDFEGEFEALNRYKEVLYNGRKLSE